MWQCGAGDAGPLHLLTKDAGAGAGCYREGDPINGSRTLGPLLKIKQGTVP
jgi:hypothetical protein